MAAFRRRAFLCRSGLVLVLAMAASAAPVGVAVAVPDGAPAASPVRVASVTVDGAVTPLGIDDATPTLGWVLASAGRAQKQTAYEVRVASGRDLLSAGKADVWDSGKVVSDNSDAVTYAGPALRPATRYFWEVRVWDASGTASAWSSPSWWEMGLPRAEDWDGAQWVGGDQPPPVPPAPAWPSGSTATATSFHAPNPKHYEPALAIDGDTTTYWNNATAGHFPEVLTITSPTPVTLPGITVASYASGYIDSYTVETLDGSDWVAQGGVSGASGPTTQVQFANSVTTTSVRITVTATHVANDYVRITEVYPGLYSGPAPPATVPAPELRKDFTVSKPVASARLYISAAGYDEPYLNGRRVGNHVLDPNFTVYNKRVQYSTYDITQQIHQGANTVGAVLGRGYYGEDAQDDWNWDLSPWHGEPRMLAKLAITYTDGSQTVVVSGPDWQTHASPTVTDSEYLGETYDARQETPGWSAPGYDSTGWDAATVLPAPTNQVVAETQPPIVAHQPVPASKITKPKPGVYVFAYPYVTSGWSRLSGSAPRGTAVTLTYGEQLNADGTVNNANPAVHGGSPQTDTYIFKGDGTETWQPRFSYAGFQYIQVTGLPTAPPANFLEAIPVHSDVPVTGSFTSSNTLLNTLHTNTVRTILNNLYGRPTDSPEYEKNGWLDYQTWAPTAIDNLGIDTFNEKWLYDITDSQAASGQVAVIAPDNGLFGIKRIAPEWSAALPMVTWYTYQHSGDPHVLAAHYDAIKSYIDWLAQTTPSLIFHSEYGDWNSPGYEAPPEGTGLTATAYAYLSVDLLAKMAVILGHDDDATKYQNLANDIATKFNVTFYDPAKGNYHSDIAIAGRQTNDIIPLALGLAPAADVDSVVASLVASVHAADDHLNTGEFGNEYLLPTLTEHGQVDLAYKVVNQTTYPSQGFWVANGATTDWEGFTLDSRSHDHAFLGSIDDWFYSDLAGIQSTSPGGATVRIRPYMPQGLHNVSASVDTARGIVASHWNQAADGSFDLDVTVPVNSTAEVDVPATSPWAVAESGRLAAQSPGVRFDRMDGDRAVFTVGSGSYHFRTTPATFALGSAVTDLTTFTGSVASLTAAGDLSSAQSAQLDSASTGLVREADTAAGQAAANAVAGAAHQADSALADAASTTSWITAQHAAGSISDATAKTLTDDLAAVMSDLSRAESLWLGVSVEVQAPSSLSAGATAQVRVSVHNAGPEPVHEFALGLAAPDGWTVSPTGPASTALLLPGATFTTTYTVTSALNATVGAGQLQATTSYRLARGTATLSQTAPVQVTPALVVTSVDSGTSIFTPGQPTTVTIGLADHTTVDLEVSVAASADSGWSVSPTTTSVSLTAGGTATMQLTVTPPAGSAPATATLQLHADYSAPSGGLHASTDVSLAAGDLARHAVTAASTSLESGPWHRAFLTDGQLTSTATDEGYSSNNPAATTPNAIEWVSADFGTPATIGSVTLYPRTNRPGESASIDGTHFPADFQIQTSNDGTTWTTVRTVTDQPAPGATPQTYALTNAHGRYLRVYVTNLGAPVPNDFYRLQLAELEADGVSIS